MGGFLSEVLDPPSLNEPDATGLVIGPQRQRNFDRFFEDSVVRDEDGEPVVVYHGTKNRFNKFDNAKLMSGTNAANTGLGHFFSNEPTVANKFAGKSLRQKFFGGGGSEQGVVLPMNLRMKNPYVVRSEGGKGFNVDERRMHKNYVDGYDVLYKNLQDRYNVSLGDKRENREDQDVVKQRFADLQKSLAADGYDGIIVEDTIMDAEVKPSTHYIIFDPKQAKSIFNDGTYDLDDDNFYSQLRRMKGLLEG